MNELDIAKKIRLQKRFKHEIERNWKICSRFSDTVSYEIAFTTYGLHRDHKPVFELNFKTILLRFLKIFQLLLKLCEKSKAILLSTKVVKVEIQVRWGSNNGCQIFLEHENRMGEVLRVICFDKAISKSRSEFSHEYTLLIYIK